MPKVIRKPPSQQTKAEKLINLKAARAARKKKGTPFKRTRRKQRKPTRKKQIVYVQRKKPRTIRTMTKRRRNNPNNTGDVNPQFLSGHTAESAATTWTSVQYMLPVSRTSVTGGRANVIEILKVYMDLPSIEVTGAAQELRGTIVYMYTGTAFTAMPLFSNSKIFAMCEEIGYQAFTAAGSFTNNRFRPYVTDLTDGAGNGILIATDAFNVGLVGLTDNTAASNVYWKILYRFKSVGLAEYVGIVQSQQT